MRKDNKTKSLHYYHFFGVRDRIRVDQLSSNVPLLPNSPLTIAKSILPSKSDNESLVQNIQILFSRILNETLPFFKESFQDLVVNIFIIDVIPKSQRSLKS